MKKIMLFLSMMLLILSCSNGSSNINKYENTQTKELQNSDTAEWHNQLNELLLGSWYLLENGKVDPIWGPSYVFKSKGEVAYKYDEMAYDANGSYTLSDNRLILKMTDCYGFIVMEHYEIISISAEKLVVADCDNNMDNVVFVKSEF